MTKRIDLGNPEYLHGMGFGGTRRKYDFGIWIDYRIATDDFVVFQLPDTADPAGTRSRFLGRAWQLSHAEDLARQFGRFNT